MSETTRPRRSGIPACAIVAAIATVAAYGSLLLIDAECAFRLGFEDGPIENGGAVFFGIACVGFVIAALRYLGRRRESETSADRLSMACAVLAVLMFVCFGEEVSWGQRVFGWSSPPLVTRLNAQNETNIHNLIPVHQWNRDGTEKDFFQKLINMNRLFSIFWLSVFVVLPVGAAASGRFRSRLVRTRIPIPPGWVGALFLMSYLVYKVLAEIYAGSSRAHALDELKETSYAMVYALLAVSLAFGKRGRVPPAVQNRRQATDRSNARENAPSGEHTLDCVTDS